MIHDTHKYDILNVSEIVVYSSNIGAVKLGERVGYRRFTGYLKKFGFGQATGIPLPGERDGFIRPPKQAKDIDRATIFFGQGMTVTTLQLAMAMAAIANGGNLMRPYVVEAVLDPAGRVVEKTEPKVIGRILSGKTAARVSRILEGVVSEEGTGPRAAIPGFIVAGKTGTSQKVDPETKAYSREKYLSTFAGFAPAHRPRLVIVVAIDEPRGHYYGGIVAGPVFRELGLWSLNHLGVNPQVRTASADPLIPQGTGVRFNTKPDLKKRPRIKDGLLPDFKGLGMREVLKSSKALGLRVELTGTGLAVKQVPVAGSPLKEVKMLKVQFTPPTS